MVPSDFSFVITLLLFLIILAVVYRLVWLRRVKTDSHLSTDDPQLRRDQRSEWEAERESDSRHGRTIAFAQLPSPRARVCFPS